MTVTTRDGRRASFVARLLVGVGVVLAALCGYATPAQALPAPQATTCAGIWVVVDYAALGGTSTACAGSYSTGTAALRSAGFSLTFDAGLLVRIDGLPAVPNTQQNYWSYWHATRQADGSYSAWSYASTGPSSYHPTPDDAEGWRYEPVAGSQVQPAVAPPRQSTATQAPATTARTTTVARATTTRAATTAPAAPPPTGAVTDSATPAAPSLTSTTPSETPAASDDPTASTSGAPAGTTSGSPSSSRRSLSVGLAAIAAVGLGAAGMLAWRKRVAAKG